MFPTASGRDSPKENGSLTETVSPSKRPRGRRRPRRPDQGVKSAICTLKMDSQLKEKLQAAARKERRSLSFVIRRILENAFASSKEDSLLGEVREKREHPRNELLLQNEYVGA